MGTVIGVLLVAVVGMYALGALNVLVALAGGWLLRVAERIVQGNPRRRRNSAS